MTAKKDKAVKSKRLKLELKRQPHFMKGTVVVRPENSM